MEVFAYCFPVSRRCINLAKPSGMSYFRQGFDKCMAKARAKRGYLINISDINVVTLVDEREFLKHSSRSCTSRLVNVAFSDRTGSDAMKRFEYLKCIRHAEFDVLKTCFGSEFRSSKLGLRHIDKGVYSDQFLRWFVNFDPWQFHVLRLEDVTRDAEHAMSSLMAFLHLPQEGDLRNIYFHWRLSNNNSLQSNISSELLRRLQTFYNKEGGLHHLLPGVGDYRQLDKA